MSKNSSEQKTVAKSGKAAKAGAQPRRLQAPTYRSFRLQKKHAKPRTAKIPSSFKVFRRALAILGHNWKIFLGLSAVYAVLSLLLVQGFFSLDLHTVKADAQALISGKWGAVIGGFSGLNYLFSNAGAEPTTGAYRVILGIILSLAIIWVLRQLLVAESGKKIRVRDAFYSGMYPLVPFVLVFMVICLQLVPITIAMYLVGIVGVTNGVELILWSLVILSLGAFTIYMVSSSLFALYIACLPGVQPVEALRSAVQLVRHRRWFVIRRLLFLPFILFAGLAVIVVPLIIVFPPAAIGVFFVFLMTVLPIVHSYLYLLYRELLNVE